MTYYVFVGT